MAELMLVRHGQARFGADDYDALSPLGREQSRLLGAHLAALDQRPDRVMTGTLRRQRQTAEEILAALIPDPGARPPLETHPGFDEYDFADLLRARFGGALPETLGRDRRAHFRALAETLRLWQAGRLEGARESWEAFSARTEAAFRAARAGGARRVLAVSSGGAIARILAAALGTGAEAMIGLNLQMKNTSVTRFFFSAGALYLHEFNTTAHLERPGHARMITYA